MKSMKVSEFQAQLLKLLNDLPSEGVLVTKRGKRVAKLLPLDDAAVDNSDLFGILKGKIKVKGNIFSTGIKWHAER
jgi:antitoxin (DNA-binding transcriptional repressor) of toxin-antitoxin stability system